jgi:beta-lactamase regulating signal transducer with metallopeptidase domain
MPLRTVLFADGLYVLRAKSAYADLLGARVESIDGRPTRDVIAALELLRERELNSVLMHELRHARRHDNLIRLIYEVALCGLWFHPLVWITGSRLALYRELSCDESVIQNGHGGDLVSALAKLANPDKVLLLQATAASFMGHRLVQLTAARPPRMRVATNTLLMVLFAAAFMTGVFATVAHTACCFVART